MINGAVCEVASSSEFTANPLEGRSLQGCLSHSLSSVLKPIPIHRS